MDARLAVPLFSPWLTPLKDFMLDKWRWEAENDAGAEVVWRTSNGQE